ncbi:MAG: class I SAM-dependent methyltransferase [Pseudomonadota bacterium]
MSNVDAMPPGLMQRLPVSVVALLAHLPGLAVGAVLLAGGLPPAAAALAAGGSAGLVAWFWRMPVWWRWICLLFVPSLWLALSAGIDAGWYLAGFIVLALTSLGAASTRVPLYLSSPQAARAVAERLPAGAAFLDLGCGLGGPLARLARLRPDVALHGVEAAPLNWLFARLRLGGRAHIELGSLWDTDLARFDAVYAYLSPAPMARLWEKARAEMRPGSLFISNTFAVPGVAADETLELHDLSHARLLIWRL